MTPLEPAELARLEEVLDAAQEDWLALTGWERVFARRIRERLDIKGAGIHLTPRERKKLGEVEDALIRAGALAPRREHPDPAQESFL